MSKEVPVDLVESSPEKPDGCDSDLDDNDQQELEEVADQSSNEKQQNEDDGSAVEDKYYGAASEEDDSSSSGGDDADADSLSGEESDSEDEPADGISKYERYRIEKIARNNARLAELGFSETSKVKEKKEKKKTPAKPRLSLPAGPRRQLPKRAKRATFSINKSELLGSARRSSSGKSKREEEEIDLDLCYACQKEGGELRSCDYCTKLYHPECHSPLISADNEDFKCLHCVADGRRRRVSCGKCKGCLRESDCMTCAPCVVKYDNPNSKYGRCVFRKCLNWGKAKLVRANTDDANGDEVEDKHDVVCNVCKEGGDLICCDGCTKVYHAGCHKPKINDLPEGEWFCQECIPTKKAPKEKKPKYTGTVIANVGQRQVTCTIQFPKIECLVCKGTEVTTGALKPVNWVTCRSCDDSYHLNCLDHPLDIRPNNWRCPTCKERKTKIKVTTVKQVKEVKEAKPLFEGEHEDDCYMCYLGGDLLCCDYCEKAYHLKCHLPPLADIPSGLWKCQECAALEYSRKFKCGECEACLRADCGVCPNCLDKPKFGGQNKLKQKCIHMVCPNMRFAPPTKVTSKKVPKEDLKLQFTEGKPTSTKKRKRKSTEAAQQVEKRGSQVSKGSPKKTEKEGLPASKKGSKGDAPKHKHSCTAKRQKLKNASAAADNTIDEAGQAMQEKQSLLEANAKKQNESCEEIDKIINSKPLKNDLVGSKVRSIIIKALKNSGNSKFQDKACEIIRGMATSANKASKIILLGGLRMVSKAMREHPEKTIVQAEANALLAQLTWINPLCISAIVEEGCIQLVLKSMQRHGLHLKVQQMGCGFFRAMSYDFANHQSIVVNNGVCAIIDSMKRNCKNYDILKEGCYVLQNILCNPAITSETVQLFTSKGAVPIVVDAMMSAKSDDTEYLDAACGVLANLAINRSARENIGSYGLSIPTLLTILGPGISVNACKCSLNALNLLAIGNDSNKVKIGCLGGIKTVLDFLNSLNDAGVADAGLRLLVELTKNIEAHVKLLEDANGFKLVTSEMSKHPNLPYIQASCCGLLRNLHTSNSAQAHDTAVLILKALHKHGEDKMVQFEGCHVLLQCCRFPIIAKLTKANGAFPVSASKRKQGLPKLQRQASATKNSGVPVGSRTRNMPSYSSSDIESIIKIKPLKDNPVGNKIRLIVQRALKNPANFKIQDMACEHLRAMATCADNASTIIRLGGLIMISRAMSEHPDNTLVLAEANALLAELAWVNQACIPTIVKAGCLQLVLASIERPGAHVKVQQMGCGFFRSLSYDFVNHSSIDSANGVGSIIDAMARNCKKYDILREGCYFLQNILCNPDPASLPESIQLVLSKGIIHIIIDAIGVKANDPSYLEAACGVIANLAINESAREQIGDYDASIPTLLKVLGHGVDADACKCTLNALKLLATGNDSNKAKIVRLGGIKTVMDFLTPPDDVVSVDSGLGLLSELTKNKKMTSIGTLLLDAGGFEFVMAEITNHYDSPHLQARACTVLRNLPIGADKVDGVVSAILAAMKNHTNDSHVQYEASHLLLHYSCRFPFVAELIQSRKVDSILRRSQIVPQLLTEN